MKSKLVYFLFITLIISINMNAQWVNVNLPDSIYSFQLTPTSLVKCQDNIYAITEYGIYKSSNDGLNWNKIHSGTMYTLRGLYSNDKILFIDCGGEKIERSSDSGIIWQTIDLSGFSFPGINTLTFDSSYIFIGTNIGIFRSSDQGVTWLSSSNGLPPSSLNSNNKSMIKSMTISGSYIYAIAEDGIYRSNNEGVFWKKIIYSTNNKLTKIPKFLFASDFVLLASVLDDGVYCSTDSGSTWFRASSGLPDFAFVESFAKKDSSLFAQTYNAIYRTIDNGKHWDTVSMNNSNKSYGHIISFGSNLFLCFSGVSVSSDNGVNWVSRNEGLSIQLKRYVGDFDACGSILSLSYSDMSHYISTNNGINWSNDYLTTSNISSYADPGSTFIRLNNRNFLKLANNAWKYIYGPSSEPIWSTGVSTLYTKDLILIDTFFIAVTNQGVCRTGISNNKLFSFYCNLKYWELVFTQYPGYSLALSGKNVFLGTDNGVYFSTDMGKTWQLIGLQNKSISHVFAVDSNILACSDNETFRSTDRGITWKYVDIGLTGMDNIVMSNGNIMAFKIKMSYNDSVVIRSKLIERPFYEIMTDIKNEIKLPIEFHLSQNFPNPFNPTSTIKYQLPITEHVTLKVYDLLGREVVTLVNEEKAPGNYEVKFDGSNLSSGVYFYRMQTGNFTQTKKFVLLK